MIKEDIVGSVLTKNLRAELMLKWMKLVLFYKWETSLTDGPRYLSSYCPSDENNNASSIYMYNVGCLFNQKVDNGGRRSIYYSENPDKVYGIYLCIFDTSQEICQGCISNVTDTLIQECMSNKTAVIWFDRCTVCYSNRSLYFTLDTYLVHNAMLLVNYTLHDVFI
ncbi:hypothetical protein QYF36_006923 [Acer negundo]|nr:hypothetical protein QYF36_006923 [Acer negundo]